MPQTSVESVPVRGFEGQHAEPGKPHVINSAVLEVVTNPAAPGHIMIRGTDPDAQAKPVDDSDALTDKTLAGILLYEAAREPADYVDLRPAVLLRSGVIYVVLTEAVVAGDPVAYGNKTATLDEWKTTVGANHVLVPHARFVQSGGIGDIVRVEFDFRNIGIPAEFESGEYVPTIDDTTNVAVSALVAARFIRINNTVIVYFAVTIDSTSTGATEFTLTLPVASAIAAVGDLTGHANSEVVDEDQAVIAGDVAADTASVTYTAIATGVVAWTGSFSYQIL